MIEGHVSKKMSELDEMLEALHASSINFFPTGSRYFGTDSVGSDYDFFAQDNRTTRLSLMAMGFSRLSTYGYNGESNDPNIAVVYRKEVATGLVAATNKNFWSVGQVRTKTHIDIQLQKSVELKKIVQQHLKTYGLLRLCPKRDHKLIWEMCFRLLGHR